jgi:hypothetical protein
MVTPARLQPPPTFTGVRDGFTALTWLTAVGRYFNLAQISSTDQTPHAISYLGSPGPARWFDGSGLADTCDFKTVFTPAFKKEYIPHNFAATCRRSLTNLQVTTSFPDYLSTFKELLRALLTLSTDASAKATVNEFAQSSFIDNCPKALQQIIEGYLIQHPSATLSEIFAYAEQMDRIYSFKGKHSPSTLTSAPLVSSSLSPPNGPTPMDLDTIQISLHNMNQRFNRLEQHMGRSYNTPPTSTTPNSNHPGPLTPQERQHLMNTGGCLRCRQPGHYGRDCPRYSNTSRNNRRFNQVTVGHPAESGNASDSQE